MERRKRKRGRPPKPTGVQDEITLSELLTKHGVVNVRDNVLDHVYKIDILVTSVPGSGVHPQIGIQMTRHRHKRDKIIGFLEKAPQGCKGILLYVEIRGRPNEKMAVALIRALKWLASSRRPNQRWRFRLEVYARGGYRFLKLIP